MDDVVRGYHLFITPGGDLLDTLAGVIRELAGRYGGPVFAPHITIAAEIKASPAEIDAFARELQELSAAPEVVFKGMKTGGVFFKCCYLSVELSPGLAELNRRARERFSITSIFDPHLSLAYGIYTPQTLAAMTREVEAVLGSLKPAIFPHLELWKTEGAAGDWERVARHTFTN